jgi:hypothetical protein
MSFCHSVEHCRRNDLDLPVVSDTPLLHTPLVVTCFEHSAAPGGVWRAGRWRLGTVPTCKPVCGRTDPRTAWSSSTIRWTNISMVPPFQSIYREAKSSSILRLVLQNTATIFLPATFGSGTAWNTLFGIQRHSTLPSRSVTSWRMLSSRSTMINAFGRVGRMVSSTYRRTCGNCLSTTGDSPDAVRNRCLYGCCSATDRG